MEGIRQEAHRQGRVGRGLGGQRDGKKGINQHRLHSGNVREASIKRAPFLGPGCLGPHPSTSFPYLLPPRLSLDPSEGLPTHEPPLQAQTLQLLMVRKQLEPGSGSFQLLQAGVRMQEDSLLQDREEAASVLLPGSSLGLMGRATRAPLVRPPSFPLSWSWESWHLVSRWKLQGHVIPSCPKLGSRKCYPRTRESGGVCTPTSPILCNQTIQPRPGSPPTTHTTFLMARFFFQSRSSPRTLSSLHFKKMPSQKKKKMPSLFHLPSVPAKPVRSINSCFLPKFRIPGTLSSVSAENRREHGKQRKK